MVDAEDEEIKHDESMEAQNDNVSS